MGAVCVRKRNKKQEERSHVVRPKKAWRTTVSAFSPCKNRWDEDLKEWRPRHGYKRFANFSLPRVYDNHQYRANDMDEAWILPAKPGDGTYTVKLVSYPLKRCVAPGTDPFTKMREEKRIRIEKNVRTLVPVGTSSLYSFMQKKHHEKNRERAGLSPPTAGRQA